MVDGLNNWLNDFKTKHWSPKYLKVGFSSAAPGSSAYTPGL